MAKDNKKISINKFEEALIKDDVVEVLLEGTTDTVIRIQKTIPFGEAVGFINDIVDSCIDDDGVDYVTIAYDFAIRVGVLTRYANLSMPSSIDKQYWLAYNTKAFDQVMEYINRDQFDDIIRAADRKIRFLTNTMSSSVSAKMMDIVGQFKEIAEMGKQAFSGVDPSTIRSVLQNVSMVKNMDEEAVVNAILKGRDGVEKSEE